LCSACIQEKPQEIPKLQPTLVYNVAIGLFTLFLVNAVIIITAIHYALKIKRYIQFQGVENLP
jgi:hypothetical protein